MARILLLLFTLLLMCSSCNEVGNVMGGNIIVNMNDATKKPVISNVKIQNDQFIVTGKNLSGVVRANIGTHEFQIESKTSDQLILNAKSALNLFVGSALNLVVSSVHASATFPLSFELQNGQVTASKLHHMNASTGEFLQFNGTTWEPASITTNQVYVGTYNALTDTPNLTGGAAAAGTYYIVTTAGTQNLGSGAVNFDVGDWVISDGTNWSKVAVGTNTVSNFKGRTGAVVPLSGDYSWSMLTKSAGKLTGSKLQEIEDVDVAGIQDEDILQWNASTSKWEVTSVPAPVINAGSITNTQLANGAVDSTKIVDGSIVNADISATAAIDQSKINGLTTALSGKEPSITAGTASQYWSGTKAWQNLNPAVIGSTLTGYSASAGAISAADTILSAINKLSGNIGLATSSQSNYVLKAGDTMSGALAMGGNKITGLGTPTVGTDGANKDYVDTQVSNSSYWVKTGSDINYPSGRVGVGLTSFYPNIKFQIEERVTNDTGRALNADLRQHSSVSGNYSLLGASLKAQTTLDAGVTNAGTLTGSWSVAFRNNLPGTIDNGTLAALRSGYFQYGHYDSEATSVPLTTDVYGLFLTPYYKKGTITNLYDIYVHPGSTGGTVTNYFGLHLSGTHKKHYLEGNLGLNTMNPTEKLDVVGNIAVDGKIRFKSDNTNYVELRAPAGLAGTVAFYLPGTAGTSGQALVTDGAGNLSWSDVSGGTPADGSIALTKLAGTSDATKYLKGDKSWGTLITDVLASTFATVTPSNTVIANGDSLQTVVNKAQGQINNLASNALNKTGTDTVTGTMTIDSATGALKIPTTPSGVDLTDAANVQFVQNYVGTYGQWIKNVTDIGYTAGKVGIATTSPVGQLTIQNSLLSTSTATASTNTPRQLLISDAPTNSTGRVTSASILTQPSPTATGATQFGSLLLDLNIPATSTFNIQQTRALLSTNMNNGSGTIAAQNGAIVSVLQNGSGLVTSQTAGFFSASTSAGSTTTQYGMNGTANHGSGTLMTNQFGMRGASSLTNGTITNQHGLSAEATISATTNASKQFGVKSIATNSSANTLPEQWGTYSSAGNNDLGTVTEGKGVYGQAFNSNAGSITNAYGVHGEVWNNNAAGTIATAYALYGNVQRPTGGPITNGYGLYLGNIDATNKWSIYANDPSSPSYFAGNVGIGTSTPTSQLVVSSDTPSNRGIISSYSNTAQPYGGAIIARASRGTAAAPMALQNGDVLGQMVLGGYDGTTYDTTNSPGMSSMATEDWSATNRGANLRFFSTSNGAINAMERMRIDNNGNVGIGTLAPQALLEVSSGGNSIINNSISDDSKYTALRLFTLRGNSLETMGSSNPSSGNKGWEFGANGNSYAAAALRNVLTMNYWSGTAWSTTMAILPSGDIGIGTTAPGYKLHVNGSVAGVGAYNALSDRRYKKDFEKIPDALERVVALNGFYYKWRQSEHPEMEFEKGRDMGVIAQEVQKFFPEAVSTDKKSGILSVAYSKLIAPIIEAIKELFTQSQKHEREIASLKEENRLLKEALCETNPKARICRPSH